jgi:hypothetical protein
LGQNIQEYNLVEVGEVEVEEGVLLVERCHLK